MSGLSRGEDIANISHKSYKAAMRTINIALISACLTVNPAGAAVRANDACDLPPVTYQGQLQSLLSRRAVDVIKLAARSLDAPSSALARLVAPEASFKTGSGDVVVPLQSGSAGAIQLARRMKADTYRFLGWDYIPTPVEDACGSHKIEVEFSNIKRKLVYPVTFTFKKGRVVSAESWSRTFEAGQMNIK